MSDYLIPQSTEDGSLTFFSEIFQETFHSRSGAKQEAEEKFVQACQLPQRAAFSSHLYLLDICYGLGYNSAAALSAIWAVNPHCRVTLMALEQDSQVIHNAIAHRLLEQWGEPVPDLLHQLAQSESLETPLLQAQLWLGDARQSLPPLQKTGFKADAIFLDPFSPPKCPQLWTVEFLTLVAQCLHPQGYLATYSCSAAVRTALRLARLQIGAGPQVGRRSPGTLGRWTGEELKPLALMEQEHLQTRAAIPYRDPTLQDEREIILLRRQEEQENSPLEPTSSWKKRWF
ncbi:MAG: tRNA (5-methylaminomethyl-2-thiouridine)(34)-methyltransferase MnmD [Microcystaceae cyanobacterium]